MQLSAEHDALSPELNQILPGSAVCHSVPEEMNTVLVYCYKGGRTECKCASYFLMMGGQCRVGAEGKVRPDCT